MKKLLLLLLLVGFLFVSAVAGALYTKDQVRSSIETRLAGGEVTLQRDGVRVAAHVVVSNTGRFPGTFEGLVGTLTVMGDEHAWTMTGMEPGTELAGGLEHTLLVTVVMPMESAARAGIAGLLSGGLDVRFDGILTVKALGVLPVEVPIHDQQRIR